MKGSYILVMRIGRSVMFKPGSLPQTRLPGGCYLYVGSARGPGGVEKRILRHLRRAKKARWHIDYLTMLRSVEIKSVFSLPPEYDEHLLTCMLTYLGFLAVVKGFGSTDSPRDFSHLFSSGRGVNETVRLIKSAMYSRNMSFKLLNEEGSLRSILGESRCLRGGRRGSTKST
ncbi:MAG: GIY-YIG nuclease family protein [Thermoproteota archaeon]